MQPTPEIGCYLTDQTLKNVHVLCKMLLAKEQYASILFGQEKTVFFEFLRSQEVSKHVSDQEQTV